MFEQFAPQICVLSKSGRGFLLTGNEVQAQSLHFPRNSIGYKVKSLAEDKWEVFFPGQKQSYAVAACELEDFDPTKTGKRRGGGREHSHYICNVCFVLKRSQEFPVNQKDARGRKTRRPSCRDCRAKMELKDFPKQEEARWRKKRPRVGALFQCPICRKYSVAGVNARIVLDHDHARGQVRGFLCDSCNTGLGRFKNGEDLLRNAITYLKQERATGTIRTRRSSSTKGKSK